MWQCSWYHTTWRSWLSILVIIIFISCHTTRQVPVLTFEQKVTEAIDTSSVLSTCYTGLVIFDLEENKMIYSRNASRYFVPASNVKLFTLYACLKTLGDSIPALRYIENDTSLTFWGTGDPTLIHSFFPDSKVIPFLKSKAENKKLFYSDTHSDIYHYGPGWMWDDYNDYYQPELAPFPIFGNVLRIKKDSTGSKISPELVIEKMGKKYGLKSVKRMVENNFFEFPDGLDTMVAYDQEVPYKDAANVNIKLLENILNTRIGRVYTALPDTALTIYSLPLDTVYRRMMQISDNMLAEHLLLVSGSALNDSISTIKSIENITSRFLSDLPQKPVWVDGSGLSRYNLITPQTIAQLLIKMYHEVPEDKLFSLMATGGGKGTLRMLFNNEPKPYIFGKSGSMAGVYNLSGFMITASGKKWVFSFMNNNFDHPVSKVRTEVASILAKIRELR